MTCYSPNYIIKKPLNSMTQWLEYKFRQKNGNLKLGGWKVNTEKAELYQFVTCKYKDYFKEDLDDCTITPVPCGCCIGCRLDYSKQWAARCMLEAEQYQHNYFITLTYDDEHLPKGKFNNYTLDPEDFKNFMKRLRAHYERKFNFQGIRFFACGEYGDLSYRPHYHVIAFNLPIPDLTLDFKYVENGKEYFTRHVQNGNIYYYSDLIHTLWGKGNILIGECSWQSCAYTARYVVKKLKGNASEAYDMLGIVPPFVRMSRSPGIAFNYFSSNMSDIYKYDNIVVPGANGAQVIVPPRYYDKMLKIEDELSYYLIKAQREDKSKDTLNTIYNRSCLHYDEYLQVLEERKSLQISSLCRKI